MKILGFFFSVAFILVGCNSKDKGKEEQTANGIFEIDTNSLKKIDQTPFEIFISDYSDSIDNAQSETELPIFLKNKNFDFYNREVWGDSIERTSFRYAIIRNVKNCNSLMLIINSKSPIYKSYPDRINNNQLHAKESVYEIALNKYKELKCK